MFRRRHRSEAHPSGALRPLALPPATGVAERRRPEAAFVDQAPAFVSAWRGYDKGQVESWVRWQQQLLARSRQRADEAERARFKLELELDEATAGMADHRTPFSLPAGPAELGPVRRPLHLRRERAEDERRQA